MDISSSSRQYGQMRKVLIVANLFAGNRPLYASISEPHHPLLAELCDLFDRAGVEVDVVEDSTLQAMTSAIELSLSRLPGLDSAYDAVVAVGGDGTVGAVAAVLAKIGAGSSLSGHLSVGSSVPPLLIIPGGTGNSFYKAIWGDIEWRDVVSQILDRNIGGVGVRFIDLGWINELNTTFILGSSIGIFRDILVQATRMPEIPGRERYQQAALKALNIFEPIEAEIRVDGSILSSGKFVLVAIGGARYRGGILPVLPESVLDDGLLDICAVVARSREDAATALLQVASGEHVGKPGIFYAKGSTVEIISKEELPFEHDGEPSSQGLNAYNLKVLHKAIPIISRLPPIAE